MNVERPFHARVILTARGAVGYEPAQGTALCIAALVCGVTLICIATLILRISTVEGKGEGGATSCRCTFWACGHLEL